ncbi:MAG: 1,4-dihydroxy-2-naphthoate octaprenyltransferase [Actinomycetota bacterium]
MADLRTWWKGTRPRTLGAGIVPVVVGAVTAGSGSPWRASLCGIVAVGLQVGVNLANDAADGSRGIDAARVGPTRLVASGAASARSVWVAASIAIGIAAAAGLTLVAAVGLELLWLGIACVLALLAYSAGPRPYASLGIGEIVVLIFFGPVAVVGTAYAMTEKISAAPVWASIPVGLLAVAMMLANNIRDIATDQAAGKRTLAVRVGDRRSRKLFRGVLAVALIAVPAGVALGGLPAPVLLSLAAWPIAATPWRDAATATGAEWIRILNQTALLHAQVGLGIAIGASFS